MTAATSMRKVGLCLEPLDVLFFRDGRPFGAATRAESEHPLPQTLAGAVWTGLLYQYGCDFRVLTRELRSYDRQPAAPEWGQALARAKAPSWVAKVQLRGPWLAHHERGTLDVLTPMPAVLHEVKQKIRPKGPLLRLTPLSPGEQLPGGQPVAEGLRPLWLKHQEPTEAATGYLTSKGLQTLLDGGVPDRADVVNKDALYGFDHRTGIEIAADPLTAKEGGIYGISLLALRQGVFLYAEVVLPAEAPPDALAGLRTLALGGEGRRVAVTPWPGGPAFAWPSAATRGDMQKPLLILTTPGMFQAGWKPKVLNSHLAAAAVPGALAVSGWDLARGGPKPTRFAAMAGSVYYLDSLPPDLPDGSLSDNDADRAQGWGCYVKGRWTDE